MRKISPKPHLRGPARGRGNPVVLGKDFGKVSAQFTEIREPSGRLTLANTAISTIATLPRTARQCAACHTGAVTHNGTLHTIDGAPAQLDFEKFSLKLAQAMKAALDDDGEFSRFNDAVKARSGGKAVSRDELKKVYQRLADRNRMTHHYNQDENMPTVNPGPGRADAFNIILNEVVGKMLAFLKNTHVGNAAVRFPALWLAAFQDAVQYSGLSKNALDRNKGEVKGVFGDMVLNPFSPYFLQTTDRTDNLRKFEHYMRSLKSPKYEAVFGKLDPEKVKRGEAIYRQQGCINCHTTSLKNKLGDIQRVALVPATEFNPKTLKRRIYGETDPLLGYVGTDPLYFANFAANWLAANPGDLKNTPVPAGFKEKYPDVYQTLRFKDDKKETGTSLFQEFKKKYPEVYRKIRFAGDEFSPDGKLIKRGELGTKVLEKFEERGPWKYPANAIEILAEATQVDTLKYMAEQGVVIGPGDDKFLEMTGRSMPDLSVSVGDFRARSLDGIWAYGRYFHNGSAPNLAAVLTPSYPRPTEFYVGDTGYDTKKGGFKNAGPYLYRTNKLGNLAIGHNYGTDLKDKDKEDLLEYLKSL